MGRDFKVLAVAEWKYHPLEERAEYVVPEALLERVVHELLGRIYDPDYAAPELRLYISLVTKGE